MKTNRQLLEDYMLGDEEAYKTLKRRKVWWA